MDGGDTAMESLVRLDRSLDRREKGASGEGQQGCFCAVHSGSTVSGPHCPILLSAEGRG